MSTTPQQHEFLPSEVAEGNASPEELEEWINRSVADPAHTEAVIDQLLTLTLPERPSEPGKVLATPFRENFDAQCWFWNRAASGLLDGGHVREAAEVWACLYLATLSLQHVYGMRIHKGMSLCNIGFALGRSSGGRFLQAKSWTLGVIEDVLTDPATFEAQKNFRNLVTARSSTAESLRQLAYSVLARFVEHSVTPMLPERCVDYWSDPSLTVPSFQSLDRTEFVLRELRRAYPRLPERGHRLLLLDNLWDLDALKRALRA